MDGSGTAAPADAGAATLAGEARPNRLRRVPMLMLLSSESASGVSRTSVPAATVAPPVKVFEPPRTNSPGPASFRENAPPDCVMSPFRRKVVPADGVTTRLAARVNGISIESRPLRTRMEAVPPEPLRSIEPLSPT